MGVSNMVLFHIRPNMIKMKSERIERF